MYETHNFTEGAELTSAALNDMDNAIETLTLSELIRTNKMTDALFEAGLKKYGLDVSSGSTTKVDEFLVNDETKTLLKYFLTKAFKQGLKDVGIYDIIASETIITASQYLGTTLDDTAAYTVTTQGTQLPAASIIEALKTTVLSKWGRLINITAEAFIGHAINTLAVQIKQIGYNIGCIVFKKAVECLEFGANAIPVSELTLETYSQLFGYVTDSTSTMELMPSSVVIVSPTNYAVLIKCGAITGMADGYVRDIAGNKVISSSAAENDTIIAVNAGYAIEFMHKPISVDFSFLSDIEVYQIPLKIHGGFRKIRPDAVKMLVID